MNAFTRIILGGALVLLLLPGALAGEAPARTTSEIREGFNEPLGGMPPGWIEWAWTDPVQIVNASTAASSEFTPFEGAGSLQLAGYYYWHGHAFKALGATNPDLHISFRVFLPGDLGGSFNLFVTPGANDAGQTPLFGMNEEHHASPDFTWTDSTWHHVEIDLWEDGGTWYKRIWFDGVASDFVERPLNSSFAYVDLVAGNQNWTTYAYVDDLVITVTSDEPPAGDWLLYSVTDLLDLPGGADRSYAWDVNEHGEVVGQGADADRDQPFLWTATGGMQELPGLPGLGDGGGAMAVNDHHVSAGGCGIYPTDYHATRWADGVATDLLPLPGHHGSNAYGINIHGVVVGLSDPEPYGEHRRAALWVAATPYDLAPDFGNPWSSCATDVNDERVVVGWIRTGTFNYSAFIWYGPGDWATLGHVMGPSDETRAIAVNENNEVVGTSGIAHQGQRRAFYWSAATGIRELLGFPGFAESLARDINDQGFTVGLCIVGSAWRATLWNPEGAVVDLNTRLDATGAGWTLSTAEGINEHGQIVGYGDINGVTHAFLLTPHPVNQAPTVVVQENLSILSQEQVSTTVYATASDPDEDALQYRWLEETAGGDVVLLPWTDVIDGNANLDLGTVDAFDIGDHVLRVEVTDDTATASDSMILTVDNSPPTAAPSGGGTFECSADVTIPVGGQVADYDGDLVTFEWKKGETTLAGPFVVETTAGGDPVDLPETEIATTDLGIGVHTLDLVVDDGVNEPVVASIEVEVIDTSAPKLRICARPWILWPADGELHDVTVQAHVDDDCPGTVSLDVAIRVIKRPRPGDPEPDYEIVSIDEETGTIQLRLRAATRHRRSGRIYVIRVTATDASDNASIARALVLAPHGRRCRH